MIIQTQRIFRYLFYVFIVSCSIFWGCSDKEEATPITPTIEENPKPTDPNTHTTIEWDRLEGDAGPAHRFWKIEVPAIWQDSLNLKSDFVPLSAGISLQQENPPLEMRFFFDDQESPFVWRRKLSVIWNGIPTGSFDIDVGERERLVLVATRKQATIRWVWVLYEPIAPPHQGTYILEFKLLQSDEDTLRPVMGQVAQSFLGN